MTPQQDTRRRRLFAMVAAAAVLVGVWSPWQFGSAHAAVPRKACTLTQTGPGTFLLRCHRAPSGSTGHGPTDTHPRRTWTHRPPGVRFV